MTEKVKTVIRCYFSLPDFQSRGHPNRRGHIRNMISGSQGVWRVSVTTKITHWCISNFVFQVYIKEFFINGILKSFTPLWIDSDVDIASDPYTTDCSGQSNTTNPHAYTELKIINGELTSSICIEKPPGNMIQRYKAR